MHTLEIELPDELYFRITQQNQSASNLIVSALEDKFRKTEVENLNEILAIGYSDTFKEDLEIADEFAVSDFENI